MILWRVLPHDPAVRAEEPGGALWFPRALQGAGRHDNPDRYGCLYVALDPIAALAEALAPFRGTGPLLDGMLVRSGRRLALAALALDEAAALVDLDDPATLVSERLRPSQIATRVRVRTRAQALRLHDERPAVAGLRWWSTLESSWINVTLFDRATEQLTVEALTELTREEERVAAVAAFLGLG